MFSYNNLINNLSEITIIFAALLQIFFSFFPFKILKKISNFVTFLGLSSAVIFFITFPVIINGLYSYFFKIMICISAILILCLNSRRVFVKYTKHFNSIYLFAVFFALMILNSKDYLTLYLNIELFSISMYFLISMDRFAISIAETMKYLVTSVLASAFLLLGTGFLYGLTGTVSFQGIAYYINEYNNYSFSTYIIPYIFIIAGLLFKLGMFPLANWMIDIYKNIDTKIVTFISIVPKLAIFGVMVKVLGSMVTFETSFLLILFALFTAIFGVIYGVKTTNLKVIMASSSYLNISFMAVALALYTKITLATMMFYWLSYIFMNIGAFSAILALERSNLSNKDFDFRGYFYKNPIFSTCFAICIISLFGFPLTSGFVTKIYLFAGILNSGIIVLPVIFIMFLLVTISAYFYIHIIKNMFMLLPTKDNVEILVSKSKSTNKIVLYVCTFITVIIGLSPAWLIKLCESIAIYI